MEQIKPAAGLSQEASLEQQDAARGNEVRTLNELELVLCAGGDQQVCW